MLHPKHNRIDYGEQLIPPDGYELVRAIGTTYSLDLEALMVLPVALFYSQTLDGHPDELRYDMLDAITKASEKITVFYQNGQLKVPNKYHHLMAYWEKGIRPVTMDNHVSSFHPKVWVIRYECKGQPVLYRVVVTSRNLTFARDWDVAFSSEGKVTDKEQPKNKPLGHFLKYLNELHPQTISTNFLNDLLYVKFDVPPKFDAFKFVPIGIINPETDKKYINPVTSPKTWWDEMVIISPFVDQLTLQKLKQSINKPPYLLSTKSELDCMPEGLLENVNAWQFSKYIEEAEKMPELSEEGLQSTDQNLHAKLFVAMREGEPVWYLGSANCSDPAQGRNVEFMVELTGSSSGLNTKDIFNGLTKPSKADDIALFTEYDVYARVNGDEQKRIDLDIRKIKYDLTRLSIKGSAAQVEGGTAYDLVINIDTREISWPHAYTIKVKPLPEQKKTGVSIKEGKENNISEFTGYSETSLSPFLEFEISKAGITHSRFLMDMEIELPESRLHRIFTSIINSREKFLKYLTFLLSGEETDLISNSTSQLKQNSNNKDSKSVIFSGAPVFEKLLIAASRHPEKLKSIDLLMQRLKSETSPDDEPIITAEFESLWQVFQTFMQNNKEQ